MPYPKVFLNSNTSFSLKLGNKKAVIFSLDKKENTSIAIATVTFYFEE